MLSRPLVPRAGRVYGRRAMQTTHKIPGEGAAGFAAYLTSTPARGDYYLGEDGEPERPEGRWHGSPPTLRAFGIDPHGPVGRGDLVSLMGGVAPGSGRRFGQSVGTGRGWPGSM